MECGYLLAGRKMPSERTKGVQMAFSAERVMAVVARALGRPAIDEIDIDRPGSPHPGAL